MSSDGDGIGEPPKRRRGMSSDSDGIGEPPKRRRNEEIRSGVDRLAALPEEVLPLVVSYLDTRMAFRTSVLSEYFRDVWKLVGKLDFRFGEEERNCDGFMKFVDFVLRERGENRNLDSAIYWVESKKFDYKEDGDEDEHLEGYADSDSDSDSDSDEVLDSDEDSDEEDYGAKIVRVSLQQERRKARKTRQFTDFIKHAIARKTKTLAFGQAFDLSDIWKFSELFSTTTSECEVEHLTLFGVHIDRSFASFDFKKLKHLTLEVCQLKYEQQDCYFNPFPSFECLEELVLRDCSGTMADSGKETDSKDTEVGGVLRISGSKLLSVTIDSVLVARIEIDAPKVAFFSLDHNLPEISFSELLLPKLESAVILLKRTCQAKSDKMGRRAENLLRGLTNASTMEMDSRTIQCLNDVAGHLGVSPLTNLKTLVVKDGATAPNETLVQFLFGGNEPDIQYTSIADRPIKVSSVADQEGGTNAADFDNDEGGSLVATIPKKLTLKSSDGEMFEVEEAVAFMSKPIMNMAEDCSTANEIPVRNVTGKILAKVIEYCRKHVEADDESLKDWDADFVKVELNIIFDLVEAAHYLYIQSLLDLTCKTVADMMKGKTPEQIRETFNIKNDIPQEEEEEVRTNNPWVFE